MLETTPADDVLAECGITTLRAALRDRTVGDLYQPDELESFAKIATGVWMGAATADQREAMAAYYSDVLAQVLGDGCYVVDGVEYVTDPILNDRVEITERRVQHWAWMHVLFTDREVAGELLRQMA